MKTYREVKALIVNPDDRHFMTNPRLFAIEGALGNWGFLHGLVYANYLSEALDIAADAGILKAHALDEEQTREYYETNDDDRAECTGLGNDGALYDLAYVFAADLTNRK